MDRTLTRPVNVAELCLRWNAGESIEELAAWLGRSTAASSKLVERLRRDGHDLVNRRELIVEEAVARRQRLLALARAGQSRQAIAAELQISGDLVSADLAWLREHGHDVEVCSPAHRRRMLVLEDVRAGRSRREMADRHEVPVETIRADLKWLRRTGTLGPGEYAGGITPAQPPLSTDDGQLIRELWNDHVATETIAERVGRDPVAVRRYVSARRRHRGDVERRYAVRTREPDRRAQPRPRPARRGAPLSKPRPDRSGRDDLRLGRRARRRHRRGARDARPTGPGRRRPRPTPGPRPQARLRPAHPR